MAAARIGSGLLAVPCERRAARGVALCRAAMGRSRGRGGGPPPPSPHRRDGVLTLQSIFRAMAEQHRGLVPAPTEEALRTLSGRHAAAQEHTEALSAHQALVGGLLRQGGKVAVSSVDWAHLVTLLNSSALQLIGQGRMLLSTDTDEPAMRSAGTMLRTAEVLCLSDRLLPDATTRRGLASLTATNCSCLHRSAGRWHTALRCSLAALKHDERAGLNPAVSHLNCCATLAGLDRHEEALRHARLACAVVTGSDVPSTPASQVVSSVAHFNLGAQQMALGMLAKAAESLRTAIRLHPRSQSMGVGEVQDVESDLRTSAGWASFDEMCTRLEDCQRRTHDENMFSHMQANLQEVSASGSTQRTPRSKSVEPVVRLRKELEVEDSDRPARPVRPVSLPALNSSSADETELRPQPQLEPEPEPEPEPELEPELESDCGPGSQRDGAQLTTSHQEGNQNPKPRQTGSKTEPIAIGRVEPVTTRTRRKKMRGPPPARQEALGDGCQSRCRSTGRVPQLRLMRGALKRWSGR
eukprot:COSAG06_NODE_1083_length_10780_cov_2.547608_2_plen_525_part_00